MLNLSNTDQVCVDFYEIHWSYVSQYGLDQLTIQNQRIYLRGEEIVNELFNS